MILFSLHLANLNPNRSHQRLPRQVSSHASLCQASVTPSRFIIDTCSHSCFLFSTVCLRLPHLFFVASKIHGETLETDTAGKIHVDSNQT